MGDLYAVRETKECNDLIEWYQKKFHNKFGRYPVLTNLDREAVRFLRKLISYEELTSAITHYFKMQDEWFQQKAYSVPTFKENINKVLADMGVADEKERESRSIKVMGEIEKALLTKFGTRLPSITAEEKGLALIEIRQRLHIAPDGSQDWMVNP